MFTVGHSRKEPICQINCIFETIRSEKSRNSLTIQQWVQVSFVNNNCKNTSITTCSTVGCLSWAASPVVVSLYSSRRRREITGNVDNFKFTPKQLSPPVHLNCKVFNCKVSLTSIQLQVCQYFSKLISFTRPSPDVVLCGWLGSKHYLFTRPHGASTTYTHAFPLNL